METWVSGSRRSDDIVSGDQNLHYSRLSDGGTNSDMSAFNASSTVLNSSESSHTDAESLNGSVSNATSAQDESFNSTSKESNCNGSVSPGDDEPLSSLDTSSESVGPWHHLEALLINSGIPSDLINYHLNEGNIELIQTFLDYISAPALRSRLKQHSTFNDAIDLIRKSSNILILTGAGLSVSCGIPDFRSENGVYARLKVEYPELPDPQAMFDMKFFETEPRPFFRFAKEIFPGNYEPSLSHKFISYLEQKNKLLRNYTQNIDTLEKSVGLTNVVYCHGSFSRATCQNCRKKVDCTAIKEDIFNQKIPRCDDCLPLFSESEDDSVADPIFKPDIVFFGENLPEEFYTSLQNDCEKVDLLLVMGSSLKVRPVGAIPTEVPPTIPQILINREPHHHQNFDIELLGDCDFIVQQIMSKLDPDWTELKQTPVKTKYQEFSSLKAQSSSSKADTASSCSESAQRSKSLSAQTKAGGSSGTMETSSRLENDESSQLALFDEPPLKKPKILLSANIAENVYSFIPPNVTLFVNAKVFDSDLENISMRLEDSEGESENDENSGDSATEDDEKPSVDNLELPPNSEKRNQNGVHQNSSANLSDPDESSKVADD